MDKYIVDIINVLAKYNSSYIAIDNEFSIKKIHSLLINNNIYEPSNATEMIYLGWYYQYTENNYAKMKKYYLMAIDEDDPIAMNNLGVYYKDIKQDYDQMKKYYLMAINKDYSNAIYNLAMYYRQIEINYANMKKYFYMAIDKGDPRAINKLKTYYNNNNLWMEKVIDFYQHDIEINENHVVEMFEQHKLIDDKLMDLIMIVDLKSYENCPEHIKSMQNNYIQSIKNELNALNKCPKELVNLTIDFIMTCKKQKNIY